jgi:hypothetical protein
MFAPFWPPLGRSDPRNPSPASVVSAGLILRPAQRNRLAPITPHDHFRLGDRAHALVGHDHPASASWHSVGRVHWCQRSPPSRRAVRQMRARCSCRRRSGRSPPADARDATAPDNCKSARQRARRRRMFGRLRREAGGRRRSRDGEAVACVGPDCGARGRRCRRGASINLAATQMLAENRQIIEAADPIAFRLCAQWRGRRAQRSLAPRRNGQAPPPSFVRSQRR